MIGYIFMFNLRYGHTLGMVKPFMTELYPQLCDIMGEAYPDLITRAR